MRPRVLTLGVVNNTLVDYPRLYSLYDLLKATESIDGDIAEVGVYKGGTALFIRSNASDDKNLYLFDTFTGMPKVDPSKDLHHTGDFANTSLDHVANLLSLTQNYYIFQGLFPADTGRFIDNARFSFVHIDADIYQSVKESLEFFFSRMSKGGITALDDYNDPGCPGAKLAADEFAAANGLTIEPTVQSQAIIRF